FEKCRHRSLALACGRHSGVGIVDKKVQKTDLFENRRNGTLSNMKSYASFCPVAKTSEFFAERWTPLLLRELCLGASRFSEFQQGIPMISKALLAQRLRELEDVGIIEKGPADQRAGSAYRLTQAGEALRPLIDMMGEWGQAH